MECQYGRRRKEVINMPMGQTIPLAGRLQIFSMDLLSLPMSYGYQYLLTMMDITTKWVELQPLRAAKSEPIVKWLEREFFPRYQAKVIVCDYGPEFRGKAIMELAKKHNCEIKYGISNYSNDKPIERLHVEINALIRKGMIKHKFGNDKWSLYLPTILKTLRCSNDSTGYSPYLRVYGISPEEPLIQFRDQPGEEEEPLLIDNPDEPGGLIVRQHGQERTLYPIQIQNKTFYADVCALEEDHIEAAENAQRRLDLARQEAHERANEARQKKVKFYKPILNELVDWNQPRDQEVPNRKTAIEWRGPYAVVEILGAFKVMLQEFRPADNSLSQRKFSASIHMLRPTLHFSQKSRENFCPGWLKNEHVDSH